MKSHSKRVKILPLLKKNKKFALLILSTYNGVSVTPPDFHSSRFLPFSLIAKYLLWYDILNFLTQKFFFQSSNDRLKKIC